MAIILIFIRQILITLAVLVILTIQGLFSTAPVIAILFIVIIIISLISCLVTLPPHLVLLRLLLLLPLHHHRPLPGLAELAGYDPFSQYP